MRPEERPVTFSPLSSVSTLVVSEICFLRECLAEILTRYPEIKVCGLSGSLADALAAAGALRPAIVLLDVAFPGSFGIVAKFYSAVPETSVVALAIVETEENVLAWVEAGVAGYVPNTASVDELVSLLREISRGEQTCSSRISGSLLRRVAATGRGVPGGCAISVTDPPRVRDLAAARRGAQQQGYRAEPSHQPRNHEVACAQSAQEAEPAEAR